MERETPTADQDLMALVCAGDRHAFRQLYERHAARVYRYLWRMLGDEALAQDLRQEAFVRLWDARRGWRARGSVGGFLVRVARNLALNAGRDARVRRRCMEEHAPASPLTAPSPEVLLRRADLAARVHAAIDALPERVRDVFSLKYDAGLSYQEIARLLDISPRTVQVHMGRAYRLLREALADLQPDHVEEP